MYYRTYIFNMFYDWHRLTIVANSKEEALDIAKKYYDEYYTINVDKKDISIDEYKTINDNIIEEHL